MGSEGCVGGAGLTGFAGSGLAGFGSSVTFIATGSLSSALPATMSPDWSLPSDCSESGDLNVLEGEIRKNAAAAPWR
ncbi:hypothetical protein, partial [Mesorhizobium sp.]|uniref:hypothetical protein n=1 Tax=Mesorhizobium sp. TaxID=1871066 RepID=UPI0025DF3E18